MNLLQRISAVFGAYKYQTKKSIALFPQYLANNAEWILTGNENFIRDGFYINAIIYAAIMYKVRAAQAAPLMAYAGTPEQREALPPDHPLSRLLTRPNKFQSFLELDAEARVYLNLFGNAYIYFQRRTRKAYPDAFYTLPPYRVQHVYNGSELVGYKYLMYDQAQRDGFPILLEDMMHVRLPNPGDPFVGMGKGLSPLFPAGHSGDSDNALTAYIKQFIDFGAMPPGILSFDTSMTDKDVAQARRRWQEIYGGSFNWTDVAVLDQGGKYEKIGSALNELASNILDARNENRIAMCFGVPLPLIETNPQIVQSTYSNLETYEMFFWNNTMIPELRWFEAEWVYYLRGEDDSFPAYNISGVPILVKARDEHAKLILDGAKGGFFTRADVKAAFGEQFDPLLDNVYLMPFSVQVIAALPKTEAASTGEAAAATSDTEEEREDSAAEMDNKSAQLYPQEKREIFWKQFIRTAARYHSPASQAARDALNNDERNILALLHGTQKAAYRKAKSINYDQLGLDFGAYLDGDSKTYWINRFRPVFNAVTTAQAERLSTTFGMDFSLVSVLANEWIENYKLQFADPIADTSKEQIQAILEQASFEGWSIPQIRENLELLFEQWAEGDLSEMTEEEREQTYFATERLPPYRTETIARTEMLRASNAASMAIYDEWGVPQKEWLSTPDSRTRPSHQTGIAFGSPNIVNINEKFTLNSGAMLSFPGDPSAPIEETANCRCTVLPVFEGI